MNEAVEKILTESHLETEDKELWREYLKWAPAFFAERFVELFKNSLHILPDATVNLRQKIAASDDEGLQQVILDQELETLKAYLKNN